MLTGADQIHNLWSSVVTITNQQEPRGTGDALLLIIEQIFVHFQIPQMKQNDVKS